MNNEQNRKGQGSQGLTRRGILGAGAGMAAATALPTGLAAKAASAATQGWQPKFFTAAQAHSVAILCDLILPKTDTPSATEAGVHEYIDEALSVADPDEQLEFLGGLAWLDARSVGNKGKTFADLSESDQFAALDEIADDKRHAKGMEAGAAFFTDLKSRTLFGYYTSKTGRTAALGLPENVRREKLQGCTHGSGAHD